MSKVIFCSYPYHHPHHLRHNLILAIMIILLCAAHAKSARLKFSEWNSHRAPWPTILPEHHCCHHHRQCRHNCHHHRYIFKYQVSYKYQVSSMIICFRDPKWETRFIRALNHTHFEGVTVNFPLYERNLDKEQWQILNHLDLVKLLLKSI